MNRMEFMRQLEELLAGISSAEKEEAIQYYNDYFDDAGVENESEVIRALGTPIRVAETIKAELNGKNPEEWEFTEAGCTNMGNRKNPVVPVNEMYSQNGNSYQNTYNNGNMNQAPKNDAGKMILIVLILLVTSPFWLSLLGTVVGLILSILGVIVALIVAFAACTVAFIVSAIIVFVMSFAKMCISPLLGILMLGISFLLAGLGILFAMLTSWICVKLLPGCFRGIINICRKPFNRRGGQMA